MTKEKAINPKQVCIYCWRTKDEVCFHPEHVIPDALGGLLTLQNHVCVDCNKWLGANVDHHILKHPDILNALAALGDIERHDRILKYNYDAKLISESGAKFLAIQPPDLHSGLHTFLFSTQLR